MSEPESKISIPEREREFCRAVARLCRERGLRKFNGSYEPPFGDPWGDRVEMAWEQGRHGEDSDKLFISSTVRVWTRLGPKP